MRALGAVALALDDFDDRSARAGRAERHEHGAGECRAQRVARSNRKTSRSLAPNGEANRVRVEVFRTAERNNPLSTFIMSVFGMSTADISARATAHAARANAITCVRPFTIPDRWTENNIPPNDTFDRYDNFGNEIPNADECPGQTATTCSARTKGRSSFFAPAQVTTLNPRSTNLGTCQGTSKV